MITGDFLFGSRKHRHLAHLLKDHGAVYFVLHSIEQWISKNQEQGQVR